MAVKRESFRRKNEATLETASAWYVVLETFPANMFYNADSTFKVRRNTLNQVKALWGNSGTLLGTSSLLWLGLEMFIFMVYGDKEVKYMFGVL